MGRAGAHGGGAARRVPLPLLDEVDPDGIVITKHGRPVARLIPFGLDSASLIGSLKGKVSINGDITMELDDADVVRALGRVHVWPLTREIAATSVVHKVPLLTRDRALRQSTLVPLAR